MSSKIWGIVIGAVLLASIAASALILAPREPAAQAEIWSDGELLRTVPLSKDEVFTVQTETGINVITVRGGKIAVTEANCPDHYCVKQGFCNSGVEIVCLPHNLVISFLNDSGIDGSVG